MQLHLSKCTTDLYGKKVISECSNSQTGEISLYANLISNIVIRNFIESNS